jgi:hypothetical protein
MTGLIGLNPLKRIAEWLMFEPVLTGFNQLALEFIPGRNRSKNQKINQQNGGDRITFHLQIISKLLRLTLGLRLFQYHLLHRLERAHIRGPFDRLDRQILGLFQSQIKLTG